MKDVKDKVWLITGCSTGLGRAFATAALTQGYKVSVTSRSTSDVEDLVNTFPETAFAVQLDVTKPDDIQACVRATLKRFAKIDVLVNNAGIGYFGPIEESDEPETRRMFEINFFGLANMTREILPIMRAQKSGHIINISSICGMYAYPCLGYYNATKFAVDGFTETLSREVKHLGIKVNIIAPGAFRTDWAGRSAQESEDSISDYADTAGAFKNLVRASNGNQQGNPVKAAAALLKLVESDNAPFRLLLGADAMDQAHVKMKELATDFDAWKNVTLNTGF